MLDDTRVIRDDFKIKKLIRDDLKKNRHILVTLSLKVGGGQDEITLLGAFWTGTEHYICMKYDRPIMHSTPANR